MRSTKVRHARLLCGLRTFAGGVNGDDVLDLHRIDVQSENTVIRVADIEQLRLRCQPVSQDKTDAISRVISTTPTEKHEVLLTTTYLIPRGLPHFVSVKGVCRPACVDTQKFSSSSHLVARQSGESLGVPESPYDTTP